MEMMDQLTQMLGDEGAMNQIRQLAQNLTENDINGMMSLLGNHEGGQSDKGEPSPGGSGRGGSGRTPADPNVALLRALRPFLSDKRRSRASEALRMMKLMEMLPLLQQSGMLQGLLGGQEDD